MACIYKPPKTFGTPLQSQKWPDRAQKTQVKMKNSPKNRFKMAPKAKKSQKTKTVFMRKVYNLFGPQLRPKNRLREPEKVQNDPEKKVRKTKISENGSHQST